MVNIFQQKYRNIKSIIRVLYTWEMIFKFKSKAIKKGIDQSLHNLFTYGTLKKGERNHYVLNSRKNGVSKFLHFGETLSKYPLIIIPKYNMPGLIKITGYGFNVLGEIYEIDDRMLEALDSLEGHPNLHEREAELIKVLNSWPTKKQKKEPITLLRCWTYFFRLHNTEPVYTEMLKNYKS